jgi:hypothetical protein
MAKMTSAVKHSYDVDPKVLFRALGSAAVTADGGSDVLSIHALTAAYWQTDGEVADKRFDVVIVVEATTVTNAIALKLQVDDADDMAVLSMSSRCPTRLLAPTRSRSMPTSSRSDRQPVACSHVRGPRCI